MTETVTERMLTAQGALQAERIALDRHWFEQGRLAQRNGEDLTDWPREGKKYSRMWYRIKEQWQHGWKVEDGSNTVQYEPERPEYLNDKLFRLIQRAPISQRAIIRQLSTLDRANAIKLLGEWKANGLLIFSGTGSRSKPIIIEGLNKY